MKKILYMMIAVILVVGIFAATATTACAAELPGAEQAPDSNAVLRLTLADTDDDLIQQILDTAMRLVALIVTAVVSYYIVPFLKSTVIPWLKEKHLYSIIVKFVQAAEKMGETGEIHKEEKKKFVIFMLHEKGIVVTPEIDALIESAVTELDHMANEIVGILGDAVDGDESDKEDPEPEQELKSPDTED